MKASLIAIVFALYFCPSCEDSNLESDTSLSSFFIENQFFPISKAGLVNYGPNPDKSVYSNREKKLRSSYSSLISGYKK